MRVISGTARGTKLRAIEGMATRPTADRIKENLFNILAPDIIGCIFLDLFSGTGAIGIEALSRGADEAVLVDSATVAVETIRHNLCATKLSDSASVLCADFKTAITKLAREGARFDIIFMDPPYQTSFVSESLDMIATTGLLNAGGYIVAEIENGRQIDSEFIIYKTKSYASTSLIFLRKQLDS